MFYSRYKSPVGAMLAIALLAQGCILLEDSIPEPTNNTTNATSNNTSNTNNASTCTTNAECDVEQNEVCEGGVCVCPSVCPEDFECGEFTPQCSGETIACGTCDSDEVCDNTTLTCEGPDLCDLEIECDEEMCGRIYDEECDEYIECGPCSDGEVCDDEFNFCVEEELDCPESCDDEGYECGDLEIPGCAPLDCGSCAGGMMCSDGMCVGEMCMPLAQCEPDACGLVSNNCGGELACGGCADKGPTGALCQQSQCRTPIIEPGQNTGESYFGHTVAIANGRVAIGAPYANLANDSAPTDTGRVYIYTLTDDNEVSAPVIIPSNDRSGLGASIALGDNALAVGEPYAGPNDNGAVRLYDLNQNPPQLIETLEFGRTISSQLTERAHLGYSIAANLSHVAAGAPNMGLANAPALGSVGAVQVWRTTASGSSERQLVLPPQTLSETGMRFGHSVKMTDGLLFVGAPGFRGGAGTVFIYRIPSRDTAEITYVGQLTTKHSNIEGIGTSIDVETPGTNMMSVVVGARDGSNGAGAVLRYELSLAGMDEFTTTEKDAFVPWADTTINISTAGLGACVALERGAIISGAPDTTNNGARNQGVVVAASVSGDGYKDVVKFDMPNPPNNPIEGALFGSACAATVPEGAQFGYLLVGAPHSEANNKGSGRAFIYRFDVP